MVMAMGLTRNKLRKNLEIFDIHAHILPGVDDGSQNWNMTMQMMRIAWESGVRKIIATPHFLPWEQMISPDYIRELCAECTQRFMNEFGLEMKVYPGEELYYYSGLIDDLQNGSALTLLDTNFILVEFGVMTLFKDILNAVQNLQRNGYRVVLAHYERYEALKHRKRVELLIENGVMIQSNVEAIASSYFDPISRRVSKDYKSGLIHFIGSDMHNTTTRPPISEKDIINLSRYMRDDEFRKVIYGNAAGLLN